MKPCDSCMEELTPQKTITVSWTNAQGALLDQAVYCLTCAQKIASDMGLTIGDGT
jgi:hypothetical protein